MEEIPLARCLLHVPEAEFGKMSLIDLMLKDEVEEISLRRVPGVHRATALASDLKGRNFAVMQALPNGW